MADRVGQQLGNYRLISLLGRGGYAEVYLGEHIHLGTEAAIKVLRTQLTNDDVEQFRTKARTIARLRHHNIVRVLDFGVEGKTPFLVMDYAPNGTLRQRHPKGVPLPLDAIVAYTNQIAAALQYAHDRELIHRDVKPENMLVGRDHDVLLSDFGIALQSTGTIAYTSPEQIQGKPHPVSDQYALGAVVYEWLCGDLPFRGSFTEIMAKHLMMPPPPLRELNPTISPEVEQVVLTALAKDREGRFPSVQAFALALEQVSQSTIMAPLKERKQGLRESIHVFLSYARRDQNLRDQLENHLSNLKYRGLITTWNAREISAGEETIQQIDIHLNTAHIILLLISANFLASEYCYSREMMRALQRHERGEAHVIPVLLRPVLFTDAPFAKLQPLPTNRKPVVNWRNRDSAFVDIAVGIERVVRERLALASPSTSQVVSILGVGPPASTFQERQAQMQTQQQILPPAVSSRSRRGLIPVGLSLLGLLSVSVLLVQHPNFIPFFGLMVGSIILLAGILLAIRALVKRAQSRAARRREQERAQRRQLEEARRREQQREQQRQEERRREQEEARRRELEEARRPEQERAYYEKALAAYEQALHQNNADATAYQGKGNTLVGLERYGEALTAFEQAIVLTPLPTAYVSMGNVLAALGRREEAVAAYEQALALDASYASAYTGMSKALLQLGRTQEAEQAHERAKQLGDDD